MAHQPNETPVADSAAAPSARPRAGARAGRLALFAAGVAAALLAIALYRVAMPGPAPLTMRDVTDSIDRALASQTPGPPLSEAAYAAIQPSVVLIETSRGDGSTDADPAGRLGTGVMVDDAGDILTSLHVVAGATTITLTFADGTTSSGFIVTSQPENDIAVLQAETLPGAVVPATLGDPGAVRVGSDAYVVGNPFGLYASMSAGIISGLGRSFQESSDGPVLHDLIQIDAAVNPGNSGGPLLDRHGRVIGIVTALINPTKQDVFVGIGLAVPIDVAGGAAGLPQY
jgi:S1-C subfamily serine protease